MTLSQFVLFLAFVGISLHAVHSQVRTDVIQTYSNSALDQEPTAHVTEEPGTVDVEAEEDEEEADDVLSRLGQVESIEEFIQLMEIDGRPVTNEDIYDDLVGENGKEVISGGGRLAVPDNCAARNTTIRITMEGTDSDVAFFPRCTKIERCGGCCSSPNLECRPLYTERVSLKVLKARIPMPGATHMEYTGFAPVIVDRHVTCRVVCTLTPSKCGPKKRFLRQQCQCKCNRTWPCPPPTIWDDEDCSCQCPHVTNCCPNGGSCGMVFNPSTCECQLSNDGRMTISNQVGPNNGGHLQADQPTNNVVVQEVAAPTTRSTTTTSTTATPTTTASTTVGDPCANHTCPPSFSKIVRGTACRCLPPSISFGGRRRGPGRPGRRRVRF